MCFFFKKSLFYIKVERKIKNKIIVNFIFVTRYLKMKKKTKKKTCSWLQKALENNTSKKITDVNVSNYTL